jgi:hypothetical protein
LPPRTLAKEGVAGIGQRAPGAWMLLVGNTTGFDANPIAYCAEIRVVRVKR